MTLAYFPTLNRRLIKCKILRRTQILGQHVSAGLLRAQPWMEVRVTHHRDKDYAVGERLWLPESEVYPRDRIYHHAGQWYVLPFQWADYCIPII